MSVGCLLWSIPSRLPSTRASRVKPARQLKKTSSREPHRRAMLRACSIVRVFLPLCMPRSGTTWTTREPALGSLAEALGKVREIVGSEARARLVRRLRGASEL